MLRRLRLELATSKLLLAACCLTLSALLLHQLYCSQASRASPAASADAVPAAAEDSSWHSAKRAGIPRILHQTYSSLRVPRQYIPFVAACLRLNPGWRYFLWRDSDIGRFVRQRFPSFWHTYSNYSHSLQRADIIRYMVLHVYGGVYLDMDVQCVRPLFPRLRNLSAFVDQERAEHSQILYDREFTAMNSAMGCVPGHPFFLHVLQLARSLPASDDILGTTGPGLLTAALRSWQQSPLARRHPVTLLPPAVFSPIADTAIHDFREDCRRHAAKPAAEQRRNRWRSLGCRRLLQDTNWRPDATDSSTLGRHRFLHLGHSWGPKVRRRVDIRQLVTPELFADEQLNATRQHG